MLRKIEYLIPAAMEAVDAVLKNKNTGTIDSGYQSAISGFGTSVLQMGLLPTIAVYSDQDNDSDIDRPTLLSALLHVLVHPDSRFAHTDLLKEGEGIASGDQLVRKVYSGTPEQRQVLKQHLMRAALAVKLSIRTYTLK